MRYLVFASAIMAIIGFAFPAYSQSLDTAHALVKTFDSSSISSLNFSSRPPALAGGGQNITYTPFERQGVNKVRDENNFSKTDSIIVDRVIVTANKFDKFKPNTKIINSSEFKGLQKDLPAVLEQESGITIQRAGATGEYSTASMRGDPASRVKVFLDGMPLNTAADGVVDLSKIPLDLIQRIEMYQGVVPFDLTEEGMGNVINLSTDVCKDVLAANAEYGSFDYKKIGIIAGKKIGISRQTLSLDYVNAKNNYSFISPLTPYGSQPLITKNNNDYSNISATYNASYDIGTSTKIKTEGMYQNVTKGIYLSYNPDPDRFGMRNSGYKTFGIVKIENTSVKNVMAGIEGKARYQSETYDVPKELNITMPEHSIDKTLFSQGKVYALWRMNDAVSIGAFSLLSREKYFPVAENDQTDFFAERYRFSLALSTEILPVENVRIKGQYLFSREADSSSGVFRQGIIMSNSLNGINLFNAGQFEVQWNCKSWISMFASGYIDKRNPTFYDKFGKGAMYFGNPELKPESRWQTSIGASSCIKTVKNSVSLFYGETGDKIIITKSGNNFIPFNYTNVRNYGLEWAINYQVLSIVELSNSLTCMENAFYNMPNKSLNGNLLPYIPEIKENLRASVSIKSILFTHSATISSPYYYEISNTSNNSKHNDPILSATIGYKAFFGTTFTYRIENYLDSHNQDYYDSPRPGRSHYLSVVFNVYNVNLKRMGLYESK